MACKLIIPNFADIANFIIYLSDKISSDGIVDRCFAI